MVDVGKLGEVGVKVDITETSVSDGSTRSIVAFKGDKTVAAAVLRKLADQWDPPGRPMRSMVSRDGTISDVPRVAAGARPVQEACQPVYRPENMGGQ